MTTTLKVGIIGVGGISATHCSGYAKSRLAEVYAMADLDAEALTLRGSECGVPVERRFNDYRDMLKLHEIDAVSICTPNALHCRQSIDALRAGKHVLCEKPMAMNPAEAQRMLDAAEKAGRKLQIGLHNRFRNDAAYLKALIDAGTLGRIYYARCLAVRRRGVPSWGVFGQLDKQGGGAVIDIGVHQIDLTWWLMGKPIPVSVAGQTYRTIGDQPGHMGMWGPWDHTTYTVEDFACGMVRFDNGATMLIECGFNVNLETDRLSSHLVGDKGGAGLGACEKQGSRPEPLLLQVEINGHLTDCLPNDVDALDARSPLGRLSAHEKQVVAFCRSIVQDVGGAVPGSEAIWTQKIIHALYRSAQTGREVRIR